MDLIRIIGVGIMTTIAVIVLKPQKPEIAAFVSLAGGIIVILMVVDGLQHVITSITQIVERTGIQNELFAALLRIVGIGYLSEFASGICDEAGNSSMAKKIALAGKVLILVLALPIINNLIEIVIGVLP